MDRLRLIYRGRMPNLLCCDVTLREMPNGDWVVFMLGGGWAEPLPENRIFTCRSTDRGKSWSEPGILYGETGIPTEVMVVGDRVTLFGLTHLGNFSGWRDGVHCQQRQPRGGCGCRESVRPVLARR